MTGKAEVISGNEQARTHDSSQFFLAAASTCASTLSNAFLSSKRPFRNTAFMRCALLIFSSELASSNRRLAIFPFSTVPRVFCKFRNTAGFKLADCKPQGNQSIEAADGTNLFFRDWGTGRPLVFVAPWGLNSAWWEYQMADLAGRGLRCVGYDRRGHAGILWHPQKPCLSGNHGLVGENDG